MSCFTNPGTSEMHFVAALDRVEEIRCVLALFEGVVTGAADGYARMAGKPACDASSSRARARQRARQSPQRQPRALAHRQHRRRPRDLSQAIRRAAQRRYRGHREGLFEMAAHLEERRARWPPTAPRRSPPPAPTPGQIATLILPADTAWNEGSGRRAAGDGAADRCRPPPRRWRARRRCCAAARQTAIVLGGAALLRQGLTLAGRIAAATGAELLAPYSVGPHRARRRPRAGRAHPLPGRSGGRAPQASAPT